MNKIIYTGIFLSSILLSSCSVFKQTSEMTTFARCDFRIESARNMKLAGINIQDKHAISDFGIMDLAKITNIIARGTLPLTFDLNIQVKNPNQGMAAMNKLDWILFIDDIEMTRGILNQRIEIPANNVLTFPVAMSLDLMKSLNGKSGNALINFALNLSGTGSRPTRITLKAKPTILIGTTLLDYPVYITIRQDFGGQ